MKFCVLVYLFIGITISSSFEAFAQQASDLGLQLVENPQMQVISDEPPAPVTNGNYKTREGFKIIATLDEFRDAIRKDGQKIRLKPGVYRAKDADKPLTFTILHKAPDKDGKSPQKQQEHIFAVTGSSNYFDLRGVVFETPVSVQNRLSGKAHVSNCWNINGASNTFEGGYFINVLDMPYPKYHVTECEFAVNNDNNTFLDCTFVIKGSVPYGYSDFYGKGGPNFGPLSKHSCIGIYHANNTRFVGCRIFQQSFGHFIHMHTVDGVRIEKCLISGVLRPTKDIFKETTGRAKEYDFNVMYRSKHPIPRDEMIPLTEDGIRAYEDVRNVTVVDTTVTRARGCFQLLGSGDYTLENVTVLEAGDFCFDLSAGDKGKVVMNNCRADLAYNPVFNLTRGDCPRNALYDVTILSPARDVKPTARTSLGVICGDNCTFILRDGTTGPLSQENNRLNCGSGKHSLRNSTMTNYTKATLILNKNVSNCSIKSVGPVEDHGKGNTVTKIQSETEDKIP